MSKPTTTSNPLTRAPSRPLYPDEKALQRSKSRASTTTEFDGQDPLAPYPGGDLDEVDEEDVDGVAGADKSRREPDREAAKTELKASNSASTAVEQEQPAKVVYEKVKLKGWLNLVGAILANMLCFGMTQSFATFQQYYSKNELSHVSGSTISWIGAIQFAFCPMFGCVSGPLFDAGYLRHLILISGFLYVFCLMMASLSTQYYQLLLSHGFGVGLAMGLVFAPSVATLSHHFANTRFRILAYGTQASGSAVAGIFFPAMLNHLLPRYGFAWAMRILGFTVLGFFVVIFFTLSTTVPPRKKIAVLSFSVFQNRAYCLYVAGVCLVSLTLFNPLTFGVTYAVHMGVPFETASYAPAINNGVSIIGRIIPLIAAQKVGPINILGVFAIGTGVLQLLWTLAKSTAGIMTYDAVYGIVAGGYAAAINPGAASFAPQTNQSGLYLGMCFFMSSFFWLVGTPISAALIDKNPTYLGASMFGGSVCVLGGISIMLCTIWRRRQLGTPWV